MITEQDLEDYGDAWNRHDIDAIMSYMSEDCVFTDRLGSYRVVVRNVLPGTQQDTRKYASNREEVSHQPTRQQERQMRRFKSRNQAQRFLSLHAHVGTLFPKKLPPKRL